jgi:hypothetical protein
VFCSALTEIVMIRLGRIALAIGGGIVAVLAYTFISEGSLHTWRSAGVIVLVILALGVLAVIGALEKFYGRPGVGCLVSIVAITVATLAITAASTAADDAQAGRPVSMTVLGIPITAIRATPVHVTGFRGVPSCMLFLGSADDVAVLLDHTTVGASQQTSPRPRPAAPHWRRASLCRYGHP